MASANYINSIPSGILLLDKQAKVIDINDFATFHYGFDKDKWIGKNLNTLLSKDNLDLVNSLIANLTKSGETIQFRSDVLVNNKNIQMLFHLKSSDDHFVCSLTPALPGKNELIEMYWEQSLLTPLIEGVKDGVALIDKSLNVRRHNNQFIQQLKLLSSPNQKRNLKNPQGNKIENLIDFTTCDGLTDAFTRLSNSPKEMFTKTYFKNGSHISISILPIWDDEIGHMGFSLTTRDVSPEITTSEELAFSKNQMSRLTQLAEGAEIANGILHNTSNALSHINISVLELDKIVNESALTKYKEIAGKVEALINDPEELQKNKIGQNLPHIFLEFSKLFDIENTQLKYHAERIYGVAEGIKEIIDSQQNFATYTDKSEKLELNGFIFDVLSVEAIGLQRHSVNIEHNYNQSQKYWVEANKNQLFHIFLNLIKNAKDAMNDNTADDRYIEISIESKADHITISFTDNGEGIDPEILENIFDYGFTTKTKGHGFGLSTCRKYLNNMGGSIQVSSKGKGTGTTFTIELKNAETQVKKASGVS